MYSVVKEKANILNRFFAYIGKEMSKQHTVPQQSHSVISTCSKIEID